MKFKKNTLCCDKETGRNLFVILSNRVRVPTIDNHEGSCTGWHDVLNYNDLNTWKGFPLEGYVVYNIFKHKYSFMFENSLEKFIPSNMFSDVLEGRVREFLGLFLLKPNYLYLLRELLNVEVFSKFENYVLENSPKKVVGRGQKICRVCNSYVGVRVIQCKCGHKF